MCPFAQGMPVRNRDTPRDKASLFVDGKEDSSRTMSFLIFLQKINGRI
jgi:hypothetical protein